MRADGRTGRGGSEQQILYSAAILLALSESTKKERQKKSEPRDAAIDAPQSPELTYHSVRVLVYLFHTGLGCLPRLKPTFSL